MTTTKDELLKWLKKMAPLIAEGRKLDEQARQAAEANDLVHFELHPYFMAQTDGRQRYILKRLLELIPEADRESAYELLGLERAGPRLAVIQGGKQS